MTVKDQSQRRQDNQSTGFSPPAAPERDAPKRELRARAQSESSDFSTHWLRSGSVDDLATDSLYYLVGSRQHIGRNGHADLLRCLEIVMTSSNFVGCSTGR